MAGKNNFKLIPITMPWLGEEEANAAREVILSGWVTQGPRVKTFEEDCAALVGSQYACAVSSCTTALHLALLSVGVCPGDVVITVSHSFIATANSIRYCNAEPVFVDIDKKTFNMDSEKLSRTLTEDCEERNGSLWYKHVEKIAVGESPLCRNTSKSGRLGAILVVHQVGMPGDMAKILQLARKYNIPVVEDAACALGSEIDLGKGWEMIGRPHGDIACFSFHPRKVITTGDGGMLTTDNPEYDRKLRLLRQHGMSVTDTARDQSDKIIFEDYLLTGYNYRMTDIQAAVGIEQLKRLPQIVSRRRFIVSLYMEVLADVPSLLLPFEPSYAKSNWQSFIVCLKDPSKQNEVMQALQDVGIITRRGIMCSHLEKPYAQAWPEGCLPESENARNTGILLPLYPGMSEEDAHRVVLSLIEVLRRHL